MQMSAVRQQEHACSSAAAVVAHGASCPSRCPSVGRCPSHSCTPRRRPPRANAEEFWHRTFVFQRAKPWAEAPWRPAATLPTCAISVCSLVYRLHAPPGPFRRRVEDGDGPRRRAARRESACIVLDTKPHGVRCRIISAPCAAQHRFRAVSVHKTAALLGAREHTLE